MPLITRWSDIATAYPDGLTPAEEQLIAACQAGEECKLEDGTLPPEGPPSPTRAIRADLLRYLILGGCAECEVNGWGVQLQGAHVTGVLDLTFAQTKGVTQLVNCQFDRDLTALQSRFELLDLSHSALSGLNLQSAVITGSVILCEMTADAMVNLAGAIIGAQLNCGGAKFGAMKETALNAHAVQVTGDVFLTEITACAMVFFAGASIGGQLACVGATLNSTEGKALYAQGMQVTGHVLLRQITASATVDLAGAIIGGQLDCEGAKFNAAEGDALHAEGMQVTGSVYLRQITASATVDVAGARIRGQLTCKGAEFKATVGDALHAQKTAGGRRFFVARCHRFRWVC